MGGIAMIVLKSILAALAALFFGLLFMGIGRKLTARLQRRCGAPFWQSYIDVVKCFSRHSTSHHYIMDLGSMMGLAGLVAAALFVPIAGWLPFASGGPLIVVLYLMPIGYLGMAMGVSASGNPLAAIGISRALTLMVGYEVPFAVIMLSMIARFGSTSLSALAAAQQGGVLAWNMFTMPFGFLAALFALQAMLAEKPFDAMIAPAEIASGPMVELGGKFLGMAFLQHAVAIFIETGLVANLFLGGGASLWTYLVKILGLYLFTIAVNGIYARYRIEQATRFLWISAGGLSLIQLGVTLIFR
jgi:NADH-quinone oxidoreductase subunit H